MLQSVDDFLQFLSTPSVGRATLGCLLNASKARISIHALRGEGAASSLGIFILTFVFLSTPSVGRATPLLFSYIRLLFIISIHALRGEGDP